MEFDFISVTTFWRILLFLHFVMAVALLAAVTLQLVAVLAPAPITQPAGNFVGRIRAAPPRWYVAAIVILYVPTFLLGAWVYIKYRTYVRIPMEQTGQWWTVGAFEFKEHIVSMGIAVLPAYWYVWREPLSENFASLRKWLTVFLAVAVWYSFLVGHVANDFRGVGT
jgi:heme A synthase